MLASRYNLIFDASSSPDYSHLILNPLSGAMDFLDAQGVRLLEELDDVEAYRAYPEFFAYFKDRGYIYDTPGAEEARIEEVHARSHELCENEPLRVEIYPTFLCNLRCTYCFQSHAMHDVGALIEPEVVDSMFEAIAQLQTLRGKQCPPVLTLFGGEPLLDRANQRRAIRRILDLATESGYRLKIVTNGVHLGAYADLLAGYSIGLIQVTLDGPRQVHDKRRIFGSGKGSFDAIVESVDRAVEKELNVALRVNIDAENVHLLPELARFMLSRGWPQRGVIVGVTPVDEFLPESEWCAEQTKIGTLRRLLEIKRQFEETEFMIVSYRLAQYFEHIVERGQLPFPNVKYCPATMGNQISLDYRGNMFLCC